MAGAYLTWRRFVVVNAVLLAALLTSIVLASLIGSVHVDLARALQSGITNNTDRVILFETRLPRVLLAAIVGGALATAGVALQGLLRNPLAEPHLIGVSGGAALGAVVAVILGGRTVFTETSLLPLAAAVGALSSMGIIYRLALVHGRLQPYVLLLAGVVYNAFAGALDSLRQRDRRFLSSTGHLVLADGQPRHAELHVGADHRPVHRRRNRLAAPADAAAERAEPRRRGGVAARRGRRPHTPRDVPRRVAVGRRGRIRERHDRLRRPHRAARHAAAPSAPTTACCCPRRCSAVPSS